MMVQSFSNTHTLELFEVEKPPPCYYPLKMHSCESHLLSVRLLLLEKIYNWLKERDIYGGTFVASKSEDSIIGLNVPLQGPIMTWCFDHYMFDDIVEEQIDFSNYDVASNEILADFTKKTELRMQSMPSDSKVYIVGKLSLNYGQIDDGDCGVTACMKVYLGIF